MAEKVRENTYFQTTGQVVDHLKSIVPADIWDREFQGAYWEVVMSKVTDSLDVLITTLFGEGTVRELIGTYLVDVVVPNLNSILEEGRVYDCDDDMQVQSTTYLDRGELATIEALATQLLMFAQNLQKQNGAPMRIVDDEGDSVEREDMKVIAEIAGHQEIMRFKVEVVMIGETLCFSGVHNEHTFVMGVANPDSGEGMINILDHPPLSAGEFMHVLWLRDEEAGAINTSVDRKNAVDEQLQRFKILLTAHVRPDVKLGLVRQRADEGTPVASTLWFNQGDENGWKGVTIGPEKIVTQLLQ